MADENGHPAGMPHMEAPEVEEPRRTLPGSLGCLALVALALGLVGLVVAHFYSMGNYSTELNVDGTYRFSGRFLTAKKALFTDRYKVEIADEKGTSLVLPPLPSPIADGRPLFLDLAPDTWLMGELTIKEGFLHDLALRIGEQDYHYDADAGWLLVDDH